MSATLPIQLIPDDSTEITLEEAIRLSADDPSFYGRHFFPKTCRQATPKFHLEMWDTMLSLARYVGFDIFRGGAKTSLARLFLSFIVAFGFARTILIVGKSQEAAARTVEWLQRAITYNRKWATAFNLRKGEKWTGIELDIWHGTDEHPIRVAAVGIGGSVRGVNVDDYRPDLILVDDPCDEENTKTPEARKKTADLFFGALAKSLAPASEAPLAKMVLMQTPLNRDDLISRAVQDPQWLTVIYGCFDSSGNSRWPERWTTAELLEDKGFHIRRGQAALWLREMECKVVDETTAAFMAERVKFWEVLPEEGRVMIAVDPTPPPKDKNKPVDISLDDAVITVLKEYKGAVYVSQLYYRKSPDEEEFLSQFFQMALDWKCREAAVETVLFARMLATAIEREMLKRRLWLTIHKVEDKRAKDTRIRQELGSLIASGQLYIHSSMTTFLERLTSYPAVNHDDDLDAVAIGIMKLGNWISDENDALEGEIVARDVEEYGAVTGEWRACP